VSPRNFSSRDEKRQSRISLMLDSGAFSAWSKKIQIDIDQYIQFCKENLEYIDYIVNLDVIPGEFGMKNLPHEEIERSASKGYENYQYMISQGISKEKLIHVFHQGEDFRWLDKMVKEIGYIGISPANDRTIDEKVSWLDLCMNHVLDDKGFPLVRFHGFAVTSLKLMLRYPWYSVDSTSWVMTSRMGSVYVPRFRNGKWIYDENSWKVCVSIRSPSQKEAGQHFNTFSLGVQEVIQNYFTSKGYQIGKSEFRMELKSYKLKDNERWFGKELEEKREVELIIEEGLSNSYKQRDEMNILYFLDLEKSIQPWPWPFKKQRQGFGFV
jgi:hypothetical protein